MNKSELIAVTSRGTPRVPAPLPLSPFSPPDRDRRGESPAWVNAKQSRGSGAMLSFAVDSHETALQVLDKVKVITFAESLGGPESLITLPVTQTHSDVAPEERERLGITDSLLRMSVGLEHVNDLIADLQQALA